MLEKSGEKIEKDKFPSVIKKTKKLNLRECSLPCLISMDKVTRVY